MIVIEMFIDVSPKQLRQFLKRSSYRKTLQALGRNAVSR